MRQNLTFLPPGSQPFKQADKISLTYDPEKDSNCRILLFEAILYTRGYLQIAMDEADSLFVNHKGFYRDFIVNE